MDFNDTPQEADFRAEVRNWLAGNADAYTIDLGRLPLAEIASRGRAWQKHKAGAGYGAIGLPRNFGGIDATPMMEVIFAEEEGRYDLPVGVFNTIGTHLVIPTLLALGTPDQVERFVKPTVEGELQWCQLFSEPAAGSDLAGIRTKAVRDGDGWIITGQKVWNSWAQVADWGVLIARTDADVPKHRGITYFVVDMRSPGVEVRPIRQISGEAEFNEVFLTEVRIPDANRVGPVGGGWKTAMVTLMNERIAVGGESRVLPDTRALVREARIAPDGPHAVKAARLIAQEQGLKHFRSRLLTKLSHGETPGAEAALGKLVYARMLQELSASALDVGGLALLYPDASLERASHKWLHGYCWGAALRIAGGTDEVLRNQIAERVLALPADLRVDKDTPFNQLPAGR